MTDLATVWDPQVPLPAVENLPLPDRITHVMLHRGGTDFAFLHESCIVHHDGSFFVAWNNSPVAESQRGTVVRWLRAAEDFSAWTAPALVAPPLDSDTTIWESAQLLSTGDELWAFVGQVHTQPREPLETGGAMVVFRFDTVGECWQPQASVPGFHPLSRPQRVSGGWLMGGQFNLIQPRIARSHGDDLTRWDVVEIPSGPEHRLNFAETALVVDGQAVTAYVRSALEAVFVSQSGDVGRTWSRLRQSNLPMSSSKTCAGRFSTGQRYLALNLRAENLGDRDVLAIAVSAPGGQYFRKLVLVRKGPSPSPRLPGYCKGPQWSYPSVAEHEGTVYVTYSVTKEDCCLTMLPLAEFAV